MFYNNESGVAIIDEQARTYTVIDNLPDGKKFIEHYSNQIYVLKDKNLSKINTINNELVNICNLSDEIKNIKNIEFYSEDEVVISTYNGRLYTLNINTNKVNKLDYIYHQYYVANNSVYYTYSTSDYKLGVSIYNGNETHFTVDPVDYLSIKVKDDYLYLIATNEIYKVSLTRQKRHETLQSSQYIDSIYSLTNILIANEHLMYIPMIRKEGDELLDSYYGYYLYRYKIK